MKTRVNNQHDVSRSALRDVLAHRLYVHDLLHL